MRRSDTSPASPLATLTRAAVIALSLTAAAPLALAQQNNPVYVDDSLAAAEAIARAVELSASGNHAEASRVLQRALDEDAERLLADENDPNLFHTVRARVHEVLLARPALLEEYRAVEGVEAARLLALADAQSQEQVERTRLLTTPGLDAALRVAQRRVERAQFWSALRVLEPLAHHPDLSGSRLERALALAQSAAEYLNADPAAVAIAQSIADSPRSDADLDPIVARPLPALVQGRSPFDTAADVPFDSMLSKPLWSTPIVTDPDIADTVRNSAPTPAELPRVAATGLSVMPSVTDDTIYINSGDLIAAYDRYTLSPRWPERRFESSGMGAQARALARRNTSRGVSLDDTSTITVAGPWLVAVTGTPAGSRRLGDPSVHALDAQTGEIAWSVDVSRIDPALESAIIRGRPVVHGGVVIVAASRQLAQRRLESVQLVGLDLATGNLLWRTPLASAGALPYNAANSSSDGAIEWRGLVLRSDELGVLGAIDAASGRPEWIRRSANASLARRESWPYESHTPVVIDDRAYVVSPDASLIVELDANTGATLREFTTQAIGAPRYLLVEGDSLFSVSESTVVALQLPEPSTGARPDAQPTPIQGRVVFAAPRPWIRGRVVVAKDALVIPVRDGVVIARLDQLDPSGRPRIQRLDLDRPGAVLPLHDQLVIVDDIEVHTYLLWETAENQLLRRIESEPSDPTPAVVYAELAYRAGKPQTLLPAVRLAQRSLDRDPTSPISRASRQRLFSSLVSMLKPEAAVETTPLTRDIRAGLVDALDTLASRPDERASALLLRGEHAQAFDSAQRAVAAYQSVLDDPMLAGAQLHGVGIVRSASDEATRRLRALVRGHGPTVYAPYDAEASAALARLGAWSDATDYGDLARRYPVAPTSVRAWMLAAEAHERLGHPERAAIALENGFSVARDALVTDRATIGELTGRLVTLLQTLGRPTAAAQTLSRILSEYGEDLALTAAGEPLDLASLRASLASAANAANRRARVGPIDDNLPPIPLMDWAIVDPLVQRDVAQPRQHTVLASDDAYALFALDENGDLTKRWEIRRAPSAALVLLDDRAAYFTTESGDGRTIVRVDIETGEPVWSTPYFRSIFGDNAGARDPRVVASPDQRSQPFIDVPAIGRRQILELLVDFDDRSLVLVERSGRAAAFDTQSGEMLWARDDLPAEVYDITAEAGVLVVGGAHTPRRINNNDARVPAISTIDLRTGRTLHDLRTDTGPVRWIRAAGPARTIVGFEDGVACFDPFRGEQRWFNTNPALRESVESWVFTDRLILMDSSDRLWQVAIDDGSMRAQPLDNQSRLTRGGPVRTAEFGDRAAFATLVGLIVYGPDGEVVGKDASLNSDTAISSAFVQDKLIAIEQAESEVREDLNVHKVRQFDALNGALRSTQRVLLGARPSAVAAIDGYIFITAGQATIAYPAPAK